MTEEEAWAGWNERAIDPDKLSKHLKLCRKNLKSDRVKCCASCPFETIICDADDSMKDLFDRKRTFC